MKLVKQVTPLAKRNPSQSEEILNTNMRQKSKELQSLICWCRILTSGASYPPTTRQLKDRGAICLPTYLQINKLYTNLILILNLKRRHLKGRQMSSLSRKKKRSKKESISLVV